MPGAVQGSRKTECPYLYGAYSRQKIRLIQRTRHAVKCIHNVPKGLKRPLAGQTWAAGGSDGRAGP